MVDEITSVMPSHSIPGPDPPKRAALTRPRWEVYDEMRGVVVDAANAGGDPAKALLERWPGMDPAEARPRVLWLLCDWPARRAKLSYNNISTG